MERVCRISKVVIFLFLIFISGGVAFLNYSKMKYGVPTVSPGSWLGIGISCAFGVWFSYLAVGASAELAFHLKIKEK